MRTQWLALTLVALGCGPTRDAQPVMPRARGWTTYVEPSGLFEIAVPPGASLEREQELPAQEGAYWYCSPGSGTGHLTILMRPEARDPIDAYLQGSPTGTTVRVERDEQISWHGRSARRLRAREAHEASRSLARDPSTGLTYHDERGGELLVVMIAWRARDAWWRIGYAVEAGARQVEHDLSAMLDSFRPR